MRSSERTEARTVFSIYYEMSGGGGNLYFTSRTERDTVLASMRKHYPDAYLEAIDA